MPATLYIKAKETDKNPQDFESTNINKKLLMNVSILSLEAIQNGASPNFTSEEPLYLLCDHGHISELAALYLEISGFETYNVEGGLQALEALQLSGDS